MTTLARLAVAALGVILSVTAASAQQIIRDTPQEGRSPLSPTGTAQLTVRVVSAGQPLPRATLLLTDAAQGVRRAEVSDDNGVFTFDELPAGRYLLEASKGGFVRTVYGAPRYDMPGTPIVVGDGLHVDDITVDVPRGAVIAGTVFDAGGRPAPGASVMLMQWRRLDGVRRLVAPAAVRLAGGLPVGPLDQNGSYRLYGLPPGEYVVRVNARSTAPAGRGGAVGGTSATYYPGTADPAAAEAITVSAGEERTGVDFQIQRVASSVIAGVVAMPAGQAPRMTRIFVSSEGPFSTSGNAQPDGRFAVGGVPPGTYTVWARTLPPGTLATRDDPGPAWWGTASVTATGVNITDVAIAMQPSMAGGGRMVFESAGVARAAGAMEGVEVAFMPVGASASRALRVPMKADATGAFRTTGLTPGTYTIAVGTVPAPWTLKSAIVGGRDALDFPIEVAPGEPLTDVVVTLTDATQELTGVFSGSAGRHPTGFTMVLFPEDAALRTSPRRVRTVQPSTDGRFTLANIPAGAYRLAAVRDLGPDDASEPAFLQQLVPASIPVTLAEGEKKVQDVRIQ